MKQWYLSKTVWVNIIGFIIVALQYAGTINLLTPELLALLLAAANMVLRLFTTGTQLSLRKPVDLDK